MEVLESGIACSIEAQPGSRGGTCSGLNGMDVAPTAIHSKPADELSNHIMTLSMREADSRDSGSILGCLLLC